MLKKQEKIVITQRDKDIFKRIYEQRTMLSKQIISYFFDKKNIKNAHKRLLKLTRFSYLEVKKVNINGKWLNHYYITEKAFREIKSEFQFDISSPILKSSSILHDIQLVDIRYYLSNKSMVKKMFCENILQTSSCSEDYEICHRFKELNTDLAVNISNEFDNYWIPIEWEAADKGQSRLIEKLTMYYMISEIPAIFYICADKYIQNSVVSCDRKLRHMFDSKIFTCLVDEVINESEEVHFTNENNDTFIIN